MSWVDIALLGGLAVSILLGLMRGLVAELLALIGWVVAYVVAVQYGANWVPEIPSLLALRASYPSLGASVGMGVLFVLVLFGWSVLSWLVKQVIRVSALNTVDRAMGGLFGLGRGLLIGVLLITVIKMTPLVQLESWRTSYGVVWLGSGLEYVKSWSPQLGRLWKQI